MSFCATCARPSRAASPWTSLRPNQAANSASSKSPYEITIRSRVCSPGRATRLAIAPHQRQPPHLREDWQHRPPVDPDSWKPAAQNWPAASLAKLAEIPDEDLQ